MPYFRRYRRRGYGRQYRRWYGRRGWTRSWKGGMNRRIQNGTRTFSCTIPIEGISAMVIPANSYYTNVYAISPWQHNPSSQYSPYYECNLMISDLYKTYAKLYDEMKIDWVSFEIAILDVIGNGGVFSACRLWTTVDRKTTTDDFIHPMTSYQIRTSSGAQGTMLTNNSRTVTRRFIAASDLQERTCWHDCSIEETTTGTPPALLIYDRAFVKAAENVLFFSPSLWYSLELNTAPAAQTSVNVSIKVKYGVTFRNAKFGLSAQAATKSEGTEMDRRVEVLPVETKTAGKTVEEPVLKGMLKKAVDRLVLYLSDGVGEWDTGEASMDEDLKYAYERLGEENFRKMFKDFYDDELLTLGLVKKEVMDDDPTELVKDSKS